MIPRRRILFGPQDVAEYCGESDYAGTFRLAIAVLALVLFTLLLQW